MSVWLWVVLIVFVILFELWYAAAFLYAYNQLGERSLLLPVGQAMLMLLAFAYLTLAVIYSAPANPLIVFGLLIGAMVVSLYWRRLPNGLPLFLRSYPRGTLDALAFRRPTTDLKRRVRTK
ncbi:hypothetical protein [Candidatus Viridilinea mediisalina]|uniref:hypothetical protein n=1 Tax=Candidatus Viridilinea mediisalina TaxID=2024553 RepID=UPI001FEA1176|nr:hypothetical protein [Candidatus Viridilinea mediisalina]